MPNNLLPLAGRLRAQFETEESNELDRIVQAFQARVDAIEGDIDALSRDLVDPDMTPQEVQRLPAFHRLMDHAEKELTRFQEFLLVELGLAATAIIGMAALHSDQLMKASMQDAGVTGRTPAILTVDAIAQLLKFLDPDGPLYARIAEFSTVNTMRLRDLILNGVQYGLNPREIARLIVENGLGRPLTDAMRIMRTVQLYSYREATRANYLANSDVVKGWVWMSALIVGRTCMSCVAMHGTTHGLYEVLNDHHNGLCTMLPLIGENPIQMAGEEWFAAQTPAIQREMMGPAKYEAWQAGKFEFSKLTALHEDEVYGPMRVEASLKSILGE